MPSLALLLLFATAQVHPALARTRVRTHRLTTVSGDGKYLSTEQPGFLDSCYVSNLTADSAHQLCKPWTALYSQIDADLALWRQRGGIDQELMKQTIHDWTNVNNQLGFAVAFLDGKAYVVDHSNFDCCRHFPGLWVAYLRALLQLERMFGKAIPNVEFVIHSEDWPLVRTLPPPGKNAPVFRFCKTPAFPDIMIPIYHFYMRGYDASLLNAAPQLNEQYPWSSKKDAAFGRFTEYARHRHPNDTYTNLYGANGTQLCTNHGQEDTFCPVRQHFHNWTRDDARAVAARLDIGSIDGGITMQDHAQFKYLVHLDGFGLSSRLEQLLPLGSLVLKEESGYYGYYHHLLKAYEHYLPFWVKDKRPEDILEQLAWARANDAEAHKIAAAGQAFAIKYLSQQGRACYWFELLTAFAKVLTYVPHNATRNYKYIKPIADFLEEEVKEYRNGLFYETNFSP